MTLTLITINLNNYTGLKRTLESVLFQTTTNFEYLIIDGGSTDGSVPYLQQIQSQNLKWISEPDTGIYNAMNKGILKASGDYLLFLNSGDILADKTVVERILNYLESLSQTKKLPILYGIMRRGTPAKHSEVRVPKKLNVSYLMDMSLPHPATLIPRSLFQRYGLYDENLRLVSDWKFFVQCYFKGTPFKPQPILISYFDIHGSSSNLRLLASEREQVFKEIFQLRFWRRIIAIYRFFRYTLFRLPKPSAN